MNAQAKVGYVVSPADVRVLPNDGSYQSYGDTQYAQAQAIHSQPSLYPPPNPAHYPPQGQQPPDNSPYSRWNSSICDCCGDGCEGFCNGCCCGPCIIAKHADMVGWNGCFMGTAFCLLYSPAYLTYLILGLPMVPLSCLVHAPLRRKLRERYGINESFFCEDWVCTTLCTPCSLCQEVHEVRIREGGGGGGSYPMR